MQRDKEATKQKLITAIETIIAEQGFEGIGVNAVAREAGVNKVLIYRYFGDLNGLLSQYIQQEDIISSFLTKLSKLAINDKKSFKASVKSFFINQIRYIRKHKKFQEILLWELHEENEVTAKIAKIREQTSLKIFAKFDNITTPENADIPALSNILIGGIIYQILRSRTVNQFNGVPLDKEAGWQRLEKAIGYIIDLIADKIFADENKN